MQILVGNLRETKVSSGEVWACIGENGPKHGIGDPSSAFIIPEMIIDCSWDM